MKKLFYWILSSIVLFSCSETELLDNSIDDQLITNRASGDGLYDVLGYGYDITKEYLHPMSVCNPVLDIEKYKQDYGERLVTGTPSFGGDQMYYGYSAFDYLKDMTKETKASLQVSDTAKQAAYSGSIAGGTYFKSAYSYSSKYSFASIDAVRKLKYIRINDEKSRLMNYLSSSFKEDLNRLPAEKLVKRYGTHVLTNFTIGGRYKLLFRSVITNTTENSVKRKTIASGLKALVGDIGIGVNFDRNVETSETLTRENKHRMLYVLFYGGTGTSLVYDLEKGLPTRIDIQHWESTVNLTNANLTDINWEETYPIYEFIQDPQKRAEVKNAVDQYIAGQQIKVLELRPMYRMHSKRQKNTFYVFTKSDADYISKKWGDESNGIDGYICVNPEPNTKPMYSLFSKRSENTFYVYDKAEVDYIVHKWGDTFYGLDGYMLTKPEDNTKPVYCLHSNRAKNTFFVFDKGEADRIVREFGDTYKGLVGYFYDAD